MPRDRDDSERLLAAVATAAANDKPLAIYGRGSKTFLGPAGDRRHAGDRRSQRRRRLSSRRTGAHGAFGHAADRVAPDSRGAAADDGVRSADVRRRRQPRRRDRDGSVRSRTTVVWRGARRGARRHADQRPRGAAEVRRTGHEERRRLRRVAADDGRVRHARRAARHQHQGVCRARSTRSTRVFTDGSRRRTSPTWSRGRARRCRCPRRVTSTACCTCGLSGTEKGVRAAATTNRRRRDALRRGVLGFAARSDASFLRRRALLSGRACRRPRRYPALEGSWLTEWGGAQRWFRSDATREQVDLAARRLGGYATEFRDPTSAPTVR